VDSAHYLGTAKVDSTGHFSIPVTIPPGTPPGPHTIIGVGRAYDCQETRVESRNIVVGGWHRGGNQGGNVPFPGAGEGGNLPFTGGNISVGVIILAALLLVGAVSLLLGRRRETPTGETPSQQ